MLLPKARQDKLTVRQLPDETLVYDHLTNKAHCLNHTAGLVWKHCDGKTTVRELAGLLQRELGIPSAEPVIHLTLDKLARRGLLERVAELPAVRQDRRKMLRKLALAALPVIMTITAPRAAQAASQAGPTPPPPVCNSTNCTGCCAGTTCVPSGSQTNTQCGLGGVACVACMAPRGVCNTGTGTCESPP